MKVGIIGSGIVGQTLGAGFLKQGDEVMLGSRDSKKPEVQKWVSSNPGAKSGTFSDAAQFGELLVLATLGAAAEHALEMAGPSNFAGKTIMDTCNPIAENKPPLNGVLSFFTGPNESLAEKLQHRFPNAHIVKAFNSVGAPRMVNPHFEEGQANHVLLRQRPKSQVGHRESDSRFRLGCVRLRHSHRRARHRTALYVVVYPRLHSKPVDARF